MNKAETGKIIAILVGAGGRSDVTEMTIPVWQQALVDLPYHLVEQAAMEWTRDRKYWPYPAELREIVARNLIGLPADAGEAWERILTMLRERRGTTALDPATKVALDRIGGYAAVHQADDLTWLRKEFSQTFATAKIMASQPEALAEHATSLGIEWDMQLTTLGNGKMKMVGTMTTRDQREKGKNQ